MDDASFDAGADATTFEGVVFRSATPKYAADPHLLSGEGSRRSGGRWNAPGTPAVYACDTPEAAMAESFAHSRYLRLPVQVALPRLFQAVEISLAALLDLTDEGVLHRRGVTTGELTGCDWRAEQAAGRTPLTWRIGAACRDGGFRGLLAPSAASPGDRVLMWFPDRIGDGIARVLDSGTS